MENRPKAGGPAARQGQPEAPMGSRPVVEGETPSTGAVTRQEDAAGPPSEIGGPTGPEPTRYGDWERKGRCIDF